MKISNTETRIHFGFVDLTVGGREGQTDPLTKAEALKLAARLIELALELEEDGL